MIYGNNRRKNTIEKLVYKKEYFDISNMCPGCRLITTITPDGHVVFREYGPNSRKVHLSYKGRCSIAAYENLCNKIEDCISFADRQDFYVDDSSEELKMLYQFGRVQIVDRGLGNEDMHIGDIMHMFFEKDVKLDND